MFKSTERVLVVVMPGGVAINRGQIELTEKSYSGLVSYTETWPGSVIVTGVNRPSDPDGNIGTKNFSVASLPFEVKPFKNGIKDIAELRPSVILAHHNVHNRSLLGLPFPVVLISEVSARDAASPLLYEHNSKLARIRIRAGAERRDAVLRQMAKRAHGIQFNGWTSWNTYSKLNSNSILFYDTRISKSDIPTDEYLNDRLHPTPPLRLAFSGRFLSIKGPEYAISLHDALTKEGISHELTMVGQGPMFHDLRQRANDKVNFLPPMNFDREWKTWAKTSVDVMVLPHVQGDPSGTYLESAAMGVPVLGFDNQALGPLIRRYGFGWTVPLRDVDALTNKMRHLSTETNEIKVAGAAGVRMMRNHSFEGEFAKRIEHLQSVAQAGKARTILP